MNTLEHDEIVELIGRAPRAAVDALRSTGQVPLPAFDALRVEPGDLRELVPPARNVDVVILLERGRPVFALLVEVQAARDDDKPFTWPLYVAANRARFRCPTCLMVLALNADTARWARRPIATGQPDSPFAPVVVERESFARITDADEARQEPYRAILSTLLHAHEQGAERLALAAIAGAEALPGPERDMWLELMAASLNEVARKILEAMMNIEQFRDRSVWFKEGEIKGELKALLRQFTRRLGRALTEDETRALAARVQREGCEPASDAVLDLDPPGLLRWLTEGLGQAR